MASTEAHMSIRVWESSDCMWHRVNHSCRVWRPLAFPFITPQVLSPTREVFQCVHAWTSLELALEILEMSWSGYQDEYVSDPRLDEAPLTDCCERSDVMFGESFMAWTHCLLIDDPAFCLVSEPNSGCGWRRDHIFTFTCDWASDGFHQFGMKPKSVNLCNSLVKTPT